MNYFDLSDIDQAKHTKVREHLLWEVDQDSFDYYKSSQIVVERVVQRGDKDDWLTILNLYGFEGVRDKIKLIPYINNKDMNFVHVIFEIPMNELKSYTNKQSGSGEHWKS